PRPRSAFSLGSDKTQDLLGHRCCRQQQGDKHHDHRQDEFSHSCYLASPLSRLSCPFVFWFLNRANLLRMVRGVIPSILEARVWFPPQYKSVRMIRSRSTSLMVRPTRRSTISSRLTVFVSRTSNFDIGKFSCLTLQTGRCP